MKERFQEILVFVAATILAVGVVEIAARIFLPQLSWGSFPDRSLGWSGDEYQSLSPTEARKSRKEKRILFLGDSFLAGAGLNRRSHRFPEVLDRRLGEHVRCRILATGGWGPDQERFAYLQKGVSWDPNVVVLSFCSTNDLANLVSIGRGGASQKPYLRWNEVEGELELFAFDGSPTTFDPKAIEPPRAGPPSFLWRMLRQQIMARRPAPSEVPPFEPPPGADARYVSFPAYQTDPVRRDGWLAEVAALGPSLSWSPQEGIHHGTAFVAGDYEWNSFAWALLERVLDVLRSEVESNGSKFAVLILPVPFSAAELETLVGGRLEHVFATPDGRFTFRAAEPADRLREVCDRLGIDFWDPLDEFHARVAAGEGETLWPDPTDIHFSREGHAILADWLSPHLKSLLEP